MTTSVHVGTTIHGMSRAAQTFLTTLTPNQRKRAQFAFDSDERENWHYVPRSREGLPRGDMSSSQLTAAEELMTASLSAAGVTKANAIIQHESILADLESSQGTLPNNRLTGLYFFSVFGTPGTSEPWGWQVDGHHLSLNTTVVNGDLISVTPSFFGANPAEVKHRSQEGLRILQEEEDSARVLLASLDDNQLQRCTIYPTAPPDLITRASRRVDIDGPIGLPADLMCADQRELLMSLIKVYVERTPTEVAAVALQKIESEDSTLLHFGWAGGHHRGQAHYYRVQSPTFLIEYDNTQNMANHIHSVWRDIEGDFGRDILRAHYIEHHG